VAAATSLAIVREEPWRREQLQVLIRRFRSGVETLGLRLAASATAIQPLLLGEAATALHWSEQLLARGLLVPAIRPPTVPQGQSRLRVTLSAAHAPEQVDRLLQALAEIARP
jgi:8-amino-7-oxononanoate synthase